MKKLWNAFKALRQLGWDELRPYLNYQLKLRFGWLKRHTPPFTYQEAAQDSGELHLPLVPLPNLGYFRALLDTQDVALIEEADQIVAGLVHLYGGDLQPLQFASPPDGQPWDHWTKYTTSQLDGVDIKDVWEPARFGWATVLGRAYLLTKEESYAETFWAQTESFLAENPPMLGPQWASGQEVALRLIALCFSAGLLCEAESSTQARKTLLAGVIAAHAQRIPSTLEYAQGQNNNHLLSEAVGLYTAAAALPDHPQAAQWQETGWHWLHHALQTQIAPDGTYIQHSTNYHRLMLQNALWAKRVAEDQLTHFPPETLRPLAAATRWLLALLDRKSGGVPNLGGNDGAYILPLSASPIEDFRPVAQAAGQAFLNHTPLPPGPWDEMTLWLGGTPADPDEFEETPTVPDLLCLKGERSWGYLRAATFSHRPAHADQLHLDIWWRGMNIAADPGVYRYNGAPPWHNPLDTTAFHNTTTLNQQPQMTKAGRFLWLDWADAQVLDTNEDEHGRLTWAVAEHNGYRRFNARHRRTVSVEGDRWTVRDQVFPLNENKKSKDAKLCLHWLLPDLPWSLENGVLRLTTEQGDIVCQVRASAGSPVYSLVRAGESLYGEQEVPTTRGWFSPTYAHKHPALSLAVCLHAPLPATITTTFELGG